MLRQPADGGRARPFANEEEMALATLNAGVDLLLDLRRAGQGRRISCANASTTARSTSERVDEAFERVVATQAASFRGSRPLDADDERCADKRSTAALAEASCDASAIEVVGDSGRPALPFDPDEPLVAILLKPFETPIDPPEQPLAAALRERFRDVQYVQLGPKADAAAYEAARELAASAKQVLVAMIVRPAAWHAFRPAARATASSCGS